MPYAEDNPFDDESNRDREVVEAYAHLFDVTVNFSATLQKILKRKNVPAHEKLADKAMLADVKMIELRTTDDFSLRIQIKTGEKEVKTKFGDCTEVRDAHNYVFFDPDKAHKIFRIVRKRMRTVLADFGIPPLREQLKITYDNAGKYDELATLDERMNILHERIVEGSLPFDPPKKSSVWLPSRNRLPPTLP